MSRVTVADCDQSCVGQYGQLLILSSSDPLHKLRIPLFFQLKFFYGSGQ